MNYFAIRPVRNITEEFSKKVNESLLNFINAGNTVYDPIRDTDQKDPVGIRICKDNRTAIENADAIIFMWDGKSTGCLFDLGIAFALRKPIIIPDYFILQKTDHKSFQNMIIAWKTEQ